MSLLKCYQLIKMSRNIQSLVSIVLLQYEGLILIKITIEMFDLQYLCDFHLLKASSCTQFWNIS